MTEERETSKLDSAQEWFKKNLENIFITILCTVYIGYGAFQIVTKSASLLEIIASIGMSLFVAILIYTSFRQKGFRLGRTDKRFIQSSLDHADAKAKSKPYLHKLQPFCLMKNAQELEEAKRNIIETVGLRYDLYKQDFYKNKEEDFGLNEDQIKALHDVKYVKIQELKSNELLTDLPKEIKNQGKFGRNEHDYAIKGSFGDMLSMTITSVISGMFGLMPLFNDGTLSQVLWNILQVTLWIGFGIKKMMDTKDFMLNEYRYTHIIQKTEYLNEFVSTIENNPQIIDIYDYTDLYLKQQKENQHRLEELEKKESATNDKTECEFIEKNEYRNNTIITLQEN